MRKNMGVVDRVIRLVLAIAVGVLILLKILTGVPAIVLGALALIFLVTSLFGFCPVYEPFGLKTLKVVDPTEVNQTQVFLADGDLAPKNKDQDAEK